MASKNTSCGPPPSVPLHPGWFREDLERLFGLLEMTWTMPAHRFSPDSLLEEAVTSELVSESQFPVVQG
jgi:hypothetical protein